MFIVFRYEEKIDLCKEVASEPVYCFFYCGIKRCLTGR